MGPGLHGQQGQPSRINKRHKKRMLWPPAPPRRAALPTRLPPLLKALEHLAEQEHVEVQGRVQSERRDELWVPEWDGSRAQRVDKVGHASLLLCSLSNVVTCQPASRPLLTA